MGGGWFGRMRWKGGGRGGKGERGERGLKGRSD